jgi:hypothetical protein
MGAASGLARRRRIGNDADAGASAFIGRVQDAIPHSDWG